MRTAIELKSKVGQLSDIGRYLKPGSFVAIGGFNVNLSVCMSARLCDRIKPVA